MGSTSAIQQLSSSYREFAAIYASVVYKIVKYGIGFVGVVLAINLFVVWPALAVLKFKYGVGIVAILRGAEGPTGLVPTAWVLGSIVVWLIIAVPALHAAVKVMDDE